MDLQRPVQGCGSSAVADSVFDIKEMPLNQALPRIASLGLKQSKHMMGQVSLIFRITSEWKQFSPDTYTFGPHSVQSSYVLQPNYVPQTIVTICSLQCFKWGRY